MRLNKKKNLTVELTDELCAELEIEKEDAPTFTFKPIDRDAETDIEDRLFMVNDRGAPERILVNTTRYLSVMQRMIGWTGLEDDEGNEIEFSEEAKREVYNMLPKALQKFLEERVGG